MRLREFWQHWTRTTRFFPFENGTRRVLPFFPPGNGFLIAREGGSGTNVLSLYWEFGTDWLYNASNRSTHMSDLLFLATV